MARKSCWSIAAAVASVISATSAAKPPDLPVERSVTCPEGREQPGAGELFDALRRVVDTVKIEIEIVLPGSDEPVVLDALVPALLPPLFGAPWQQETQPADRLGEAQYIFQVGERCRRQGDLDKARTCYEETHLLSPTSRYGRLAIQRLRELEQSREPAEEQEEPAPNEQSYQKVRERSVPLGLVERSH